MEFLSEDATYLILGFGAAAAAFLLALRITQQGKFLIWALGALGLAVLAFLIEQLWVTDSERVERVVYALRTAVVASDAPAVIAHLTPDVEYAQGEQTLIEGEAVFAFIRTQLGITHFDTVRITRIVTRAGRQSGRGSAEFRVLASGTYSPGMTMTFSAALLDFSLGFRETEPHVWKVERIALTRAPAEVPTPGGAPPATRLRFPFGPGGRLQ
jgi:hypothetical protein